MQRNVKPSAIFFQAFSSVIRSTVEPIDQVKSNLSQIIPNAAGLPQTDHPKSSQNSEKSSYYQRVLTEELLRAFSFGDRSRHKQRIAVAVKW